MPYVVPDAEPVRALREVAGANPGAMSIALANVSRGPRAQGATVPVEAAWKQEYASWLLRAFSGAGPRQWDAAMLNAWHPERHLSFFAGLLERANGRTILYVGEHETRAVRRLGSLLSQPLQGPGTTESLRPFVEWLNAEAPSQEAFLLGQAIALPGADPAQ